VKSATASAVLGDYLYATIVLISVLAEKSKTTLHAHVRPQLLDSLSRDREINEEKKFTLPVKRENFKHVSVTVVTDVEVVRYRRNPVAWVLTSYPVTGAL
jgi:hypothetical protein